MRFCVFTPQPPALAVRALPSAMEPAGLRPSPPFPFPFPRTSCSVSRAWAGFAWVLLVGVPPPPELLASLLLPDRAEARCAFKESRLLAVTHFWLSARKIASAWATEKKPNNFSFVCGVTFHCPPLLLSFQDLNANGGLKPVDTFGFRSPVRPPALRLLLPHSFSGCFFVLFCSKNGREGGVVHPPQLPLLRHP